MNRSLKLALLMWLLVPLVSLGQESSPRRVAVLLAVSPVYPPIALTANTSGDVKVAVTISESGAVTKADFVSGSPLLHRAAVEAARRWKFEKPDQERKLELTFSFRMVSKDTPPEDATSVFMPPYHSEVRGKLPPMTTNYVH